MQLFTLKIHVTKQKFMENSGIHLVAFHFSTAFCTIRRTTVVTRLFIYRWKLGEIDAFKIHDFVPTYVWGVDIEISVYDLSYRRNL